MLKKSVNTILSLLNFLSYFKDRQSAVCIYKQRQVWMGNLRHVIVHQQLQKEIGKVNVLWKKEKKNYKEEVQAKPVYLPYFLLRIHTQPLWKAKLLNLIPHWISVVTQKLYGSMNNGSLQEWKDKL